MGLVGVDISLFLSQLGYCVVYLIFVQQNLGPILRRAFPSAPLWVSGTVALILVQVRWGDAEERPPPPPLSNMRGVGGGSSF